MKNPSAFPCTEEIWSEETRTGEVFHPGMTLRDYFAGQSLMLMPVTPATFRGTNDEKIKNARNIAGWAYRIADEMLNERNKP